MILNQCGQSRRASQRAFTRKTSFPGKFRLLHPCTSRSSQSLPANVAKIFSNTKRLPLRLSLHNSPITIFNPTTTMTPPKSPTKPDLHPILARRYFDKLESQNMRNSSASDKVIALESRERQITRDRRDNEAAAADLLRRERSVVEVERRLEKRETEMDGRPTREEVELLEAELAEAKGEGKSTKSSGEGDRG